MTQPGSVDAAGSSARVNPPKSLIKKPKVAQECDGQNSKWEARSGANDGLFGSTFSPENIEYKDGVMHLRLKNKGCPSNCDGKPYSSAEYRTKNEVYGYGRYEARFQAAAGNGLVTSFFVYTGVYSKPSHQEIDFEVLGRDCRKVQLNYYHDGQGTEKQEHKKMVDLPFDACAGMHNYAFDWQPGSITFYVDGQQVHQAKGAPKIDIPKGNTNIMVNLWPGDNSSASTGWLKKFVWPGKEIEATYDWIHYSPMGEEDDGASAVAPEADPADEGGMIVDIDFTNIQPVNAEEKETAAPISGTIDIAQSAIEAQGFNNGRVVKTGSSYSFVSLKAVKPSDEETAKLNIPGFYILVGGVPLAGQTKLVFEIKRNVADKKDAGCNLIAQVYDEKDDAYTPTVSFSEVPNGTEWAPVSVPLTGITNLRQIQFIAPRGGVCSYEIREIKAE